MPWAVASIAVVLTNPVGSNGIAPRRESLALQPSWRRRRKFPASAAWWSCPAAANASPARPVVLAFGTLPPVALTPPPPCCWRASHTSPRSAAGLWPDTSSAWTARAVESVSLARSSPRS